MKNISLILLSYCSFVIILMLFIEHKQHLNIKNKCLEYKPFKPALAQVPIFENGDYEYINNNVYCIDKKGNKHALKMYI